MRECGRETIQIDVIESHESITIRDIHERERTCIAEAKAKGLDLLNGTSGGQGIPGMKHGPEARAKMSAAHKGKTITEAHRKAISAAMKGHTYNMSRGPFSAETRAKMSASKIGEKNNNFGKAMSDETKAKISAAKTGKKRGPRSEETKEKMRLSAHNRFHADKVKPTCHYCVPSIQSVMV
jgi:group I intron endonuclease